MHQPCFVRAKSISWIGGRGGAKFACEAAPSQINHCEGSWGKKGGWRPSRLRLQALPAESPRTPHQQWSITLCR
jgi:hypothetical protein